MILKSVQNISPLHRKQSTRKQKSFAQNKSSSDKIAKLSGRTELPMFNQTKGPRNKKSILSSEDVHLRKLKNFCVNPEEQWSIAQKSSALPSIKKLLKSACVLNPESRVQKI